MNETRFREAETALWNSVGCAPSERRIRIAHTGTAIRGLEIGEGPPVVMVHGATNGASSWATLTARLEGFRCIMVDRPGCGLSEPLASRFDGIEPFAAFADDFVTDVLDALEIESAAVIGTSYGGYPALRAAAAHPGRITRVLDFGWTCGAPMRSVPVAMRLGTMPGLSSVLASIPPNERMVRAMLRNIGLSEALKSGRFTQVAVDWYLSLLRDTPTMRNELRAFRRLASPIRGLNTDILLTPKLLGSITAPVYFLWGEEDPFGGADIARKFVAQLPNAELELMPGAGHAVWMDDAESAARTTVRFLRADSRPDPSA